MVQFARISTTIQNNPEAPKIFHSCHHQALSLAMAHLLHFFSLSFSKNFVCVFRSTCPSRLPGVAYIEPSLFWKRLGGTLEASSCVSCVSRKQQVAFHTPFLAHPSVLLWGAGLNRWRTSKLRYAICFLGEWVVIRCPLGSKRIFGGAV
jgi:hypothetical protein